MPTKVTIEAAPSGENCGMDDTTMDLEKSEDEGLNEVSSQLETSINMLLDDTIASESECETLDDSNESNHRRTSSKPTTSSSANKTKKENFLVESKPHHQGALKYPNNSTSRLSDSHSNSDPESIGSTQKKTVTLERQSPYTNGNSGTIAQIRTYTCQDYRNTNEMKKYETLLSDSAPSLEKPELQVSDGSPHDIDNDETRLLDSFLDSSCEIQSPQRSSNTKQLSQADETQRDANIQRQEDTVTTSTSESARQRQISKTRWEWRQQKHCNEFRSKFTGTVSEFEHHNPYVNLPNYQCMSTEQQVQEQQKVVHLLNRLHIRRKAPGECSSDDPTHGVLEADRTCDQDMSITRMDSPTQPNSSDSLQPSPSPNRQSGRKATHLVAIKLTPIARASPSHQSFCNNSSASFAPRIDDATEQGSPMFLGEHSASELSIEITRGANDNKSFSPPQYRSPQLRMSQRSNAAKRLASTSGKRGQDSSRVRLNLASPGYSDSNSEDMPWPPSWPSSADDSMSLLSAHENNDKPFAASQSPILGENRYPGHPHRPQQMHQQHPDNYDEDSSRGNRKGSMTRAASSQDHDRGSRLHRREDDGELLRSVSQRHGKHTRMYRHDETIDTVNATALRGPHARTRLRDTTNVALKAGVPFHYNPLHIKRSKRRSQKDITSRDYPLHQAVDFRDPLGEDESHSELYHVFEWMIGRDCFKTQDESKGSTNSSKGIIFSLELEQAVNVTIKLLMERDSISQEREERYGDASCITGQTLIVSRTKDDIGLWERALREHTPFSVINHAALPSSERKQSATASKCATFDVVISTYDAMKSPDTTVQLDDDNHAALGHAAESQFGGGWMSKRGSSSAEASQRLAGSSQHPGGFSQRIDPAVRCSKLSALHRVQWRR